MVTTFPARGGSRTHFGSIKSFSQASSVFLITTSFNAAERTLAKMGLALAGMWWIVAHLSLKTTSKGHCVPYNLPLCRAFSLGCFERVIELCVVVPLRREALMLV